MWSATRSVVSWVSVLVLIWSFVWVTWNLGFVGGGVGTSSICLHDASPALSSTKSKYAIDAFASILARLCVVLLLATFLLTDRLWSFGNMTPFVFGVKTPFVSRRDVRVRIEGSGVVVVSVRRQNPPASGHVFDWLNLLDTTHEKRVRISCIWFFPIWQKENTCFSLFLDKWCTTTFASKTKKGGKALLVVVCYIQLVTFVSSLIFVTFVGVLP